MTSGELFDTVSSSAFQTSFPVCLSSAMTHAPGLAPVNRIKKFPSIKGDPRQINSPISYFQPNCISQIPPALASEPSTPRPGRISRRRSRSRRHPDSARATAANPLPLQGWTATTTNLMQRPEKTFGDSWSRRPAKSDRFAAPLRDEAPLARGPGTFPLLRLPLSETPSSKPQAPEKLQIPNTKPQ